MDWTTVRQRLKERLARRHRERSEPVERFEDLLRGFLPLRLMAAGALLVVGAGRASEGEPDGALVLAGAVALSAFGTWRELLLGAGWTRAAACVAWADDWTWGRDHPGGVPATLATGLLRGGTTGEAWLARRLRDPEKLTAGHVLAEAMERLRRGEAAEGRALLAFVLDYDVSARPPLARRLATELLLVEALGRGDAREVLAVATAPRVARSPLITLLVLVARRGLGEPVPPEVLRAAAFLASPGGRALPLAERAGTTAPGWARPVAARSALLAEARALEQRLADPALVEAWRARAAALRATTDPVAGVRAEAVARLAARLEQVIHDAPDPERPGELWTEVVRRVADRRHDQLRELAEELARRTRAKTALPLVEELLAALRVDAAAEALAQVDPARRVAAHLLSWGALVNHTVWLHNERGQATLANAMYRVQHRRAQAAGHPQALDLLRRNLECGP